MHHRSNKKVLEAVYRCNSIVVPLAKTTGRNSPSNWIDRRGGRAFVSRLGRQTISSLKLTGGGAVARRCTECRNRFIHPRDDSRCDFVDARSSTSPPRAQSSLPPSPSCIFIGRQSAEIDRRLRRGRVSRGSRCSSKPAMSPTIGRLAIQRYHG